MIVIKDIWCEESWSFKTEQEAWDWCHQNLSARALGTPKTFQDLVQVVNRLQNYSMGRQGRQTAPV